MWHWLGSLSTWQLIAVVIGFLVALGVVSALLTAILVRLGLRTPFVVRRVNRARDAVIAAIKRPITMMVLDEVADVIRTGHYTGNVAAALVENREELTALAVEKIREDPHVRLIGRLPGYETIVSEVSETTLRVVVEMLIDPRMDEVVSDVLRNNLAQIKDAVRDRKHETVAPPTPANAPRSTDRTSVQGRFM